MDVTTVRKTSSAPIRLRPVPGAAWGDFSTSDGRWLVRARVDIHSVRDLGALVVEMAKGVSTAPSRQRACLVLLDPRMSRARLAEEWRVLLHLLQAGIARRMAFVVLQRGVGWAIPDEPAILAVGQALRRQLPEEPSQATRERKPLSRKSFEVLKVLVHGWLLRRGPVAISELMRVSGCSYPTVAVALRGWQKSGDLVRHSNRSVSLRAFPNEAWSQALALSQAFRASTTFSTRSDRPLDVQDLLRRLEKSTLSGIALGGVVAALHWNPELDLHGLPRIDLCVHVPSGVVRPDLLAALDPALAPVEEQRSGARIVVHPLRRPESLFVARKGSKVPVADPVETLLDLHELHLTGQASDLVRRLSSEEPR